MGRVSIRRTWPCGTQESIELTGLWVQASANDEGQGPCPVHGLLCHKGIGQA